MTTERAPVAASREEFLNNLAASGLPEVATPETTEELLPANDTRDGNALASAFVAAGRLTSFQAEAILAGRLTDLRIGNYDILTLIGQGGMGKVFKARHRRMKRVVALKLLSRSVEQSKNMIQRFHREVEIIARLNHPNIVMAFDADEAEAGLFLVMEFVDGRDLASEVSRVGPLSVAEAVNYTIQAARGLGYAHENKLIHRDIKPANILLDVSGRIKVADLGLARLANTDLGDRKSLTQSGGVLGTIDYMSPEQALDSTTIDHRSDQYSLGCTLHFLLTAQPVFSVGSDMAILLKHRDAPIPSLVCARPDVPAELDAIFCRMVAKKPEDRFPTMTEVIQALEALPAVSAARPLHVVPQADSYLWPGRENVTAGASSENIYQDATSTAIAPTETAGPSVAGLSVVLAEASRTQAGIIRKYLEQLGITGVQVAPSGARALEMTRIGPAQVLLSSMHLSDMTGVQLAQSLRADPALTHVGFVLTTSESDEALVAGLQGAARTVLMPKPFDLPRLSQALAEAAGLLPSD